MAEANHPSSETTTFNGKISVNQRFMQLAEDLLLCGVCLAELQHPKILPCVHTYCKMCIERLIKHNNLSCPECRDNNEVRRAEDLKNNHLIEKIQEFLGKLPRSFPECDVCIEKRKDTQAVQHCQQCNINFCKDCVSDHKDIGLFREHQVVDIPSKNGCTLHPTRPQDVFCVTCNLSNCCLCAVLGHKDHSLTKVDIGRIYRKHVIDLDRYNTELKFLLETLKKKKNEILISLSKLKDSCSSFCGEAGLKCVQEIEPIAQQSHLLIILEKEHAYYESKLQKKYKDTNEKYNKTAEYAALIDNCVNTKDVKHETLLEWQSLVHEVNNYLGKRKFYFFQKSEGEPDIRFIFNENATSLGNMVSLSCPQLASHFCPTFKNVVDVDICRGMISIADIGDSKVSLYHYISAKIMFVESMSSKTPWTRQESLEPLSVCLAQSTLYVADCLTGSILVFEQYISWSGDIGKNRLKEPCWLTANADGTINVCDKDNRSLSVYQKNGELVHYKAGLPCFPSYLCSDYFMKTFYFCNVDTGEVCSFQYTDSEYHLNILMQKDSVKGIGIDSMYVCDNHSVTSYDPSGNYREEVILNLVNPQVMCVREDKIVVVTKEQDGHLIQLFQILHNMKKYQTR